jgi:3-deoxy-D-arabino-heptulosonate 7-phosphate (DAHP) synthase
MDKMQMDGFYRKVDAQAQQVASSHGGMASDVATEVGTEVVVEIVDVGLEAASDGVDLLDIGVDFFLDIASGIGDLF